MDRRNRRRQRARAADRPVDPAHGASRIESDVSGTAGTPHKSEGTANLDLTFKDMNGAEVRLADYKGKVILLNVWATWCGPCELEIPELVEAYSKYKDQGVVVLGRLAR